MFLNIGTCPSCPNGDTRANMHYKHSLVTKDNQTHVAKAHKHAKHVGANVTINVHHHLHPHQPSESTDIIHYIVDPIGGSTTEQPTTSTENFKPTDSSTTTTTDSTGVVFVSPPPPPAPPALTFITAPPGETPVVHIVPGELPPGTKRGGGGAIVLPPGVLPPGELPPASDAPTVRVITEPNGTVHYVIEPAPASDKNKKDHGGEPGFSSPPFNGGGGGYEGFSSPPWGGSGSDFEPMFGSPPMGGGGIYYSPGMPPSKGGKPVKRTPGMPGPEPGFSSPPFTGGGGIYYSPGMPPSKGGKPTKPTPGTPVPEPTPGVPGGEVVPVVPPPKKFHYVPGPAGMPPIRVPILPSPPKPGPEPNTPFWSTTTTTTESTADAKWHDSPPTPPTEGRWCSICMDKAPPALPDGVTFTCPACPTGNVCGACPTGSVASRRSLLAVPSWLGGKSAGGDVTNYVVGVQSTLPRNAGGATMYLSADACTPCDGSGLVSSA